MWNRSEKCPGNNLGPAGITVAVTVAMDNQSATEQAKSYIANRCDGPITSFVMVSRAMEPHMRRKYTASELANALHELLVEFGWLDDGDLIETGS